MANTSKSIDNLTIKITANAGDANTALEQLIKNITTLGNALNGVDTKTFANGIKDIGTLCEFYGTEGREGLRKATLRWQGSLDKRVNVE